MSEILENSDDCLQDLNCPIPELIPSAYVGFSQYPDQFILYPSKKGFIFNILCVGDVGLGKTTLLNSLFNIKEEIKATDETESVSHRSYDLYEGGTKLEINLSETVNYGRGKSEDWSDVCNFIDNQHDKLLEEELSVNRPNESFKDSRIHCCFYFIPPNTRNQLRSFDLMAMSNLSTRVNLIPVIAKSDSLTRSELQNLKSSVLSSLKVSKIPIFNFANGSDSSSATLNAFVPFAIVGSQKEVKIGHRMVYGRQYPWGVVQVENETHCDFIRLREAVIRTNMQRLVDTTDEIYEVYRKYRLEEFGCLRDNSLSIDEIYVQKRAQLVNDIQFKESALRNSFIERINEKETELKKLEKQLNEKFEKLETEQNIESGSLDAQFNEINEEIALFREMKDLYEAKIRKKK